MAHPDYTRDTYVYNKEQNIKHKWNVCPFYKTIKELSDEKEFLAIAEDVGNEAIKNIVATVREIKSNRQRNLYRKVTMKQKEAIALALVEHFTMQTLFEKAYPGHQF